MNPHLVTLCLAGGLFAIMVFVHAFTDFVCQTHYEAMNKHNNAAVRARHCLIYAVGFAPLLALLAYFGALSPWEVVAAVNILFWSHFVEDTYYPVVLWAKHVRCPPCMCWRLNYMLDNTAFYQNKALGTGPQTPTEQWRLDILKELNSVLHRPNLGPYQAKLDHGGFLEFINEFLGKYLMIAIDQIIHFSFLFPIIWMALN